MELRPIGKPVFFIHNGSLLGGIEKKFQEAGIEKVHVDMDNKQVHLTGKELSDEEIRKIVTWAGYEAGDISRK